MVNVDNLGLGKSLAVGDLHFEGLELMNAKNAVVCAVQLTRAALWCLQPRLEPDFCGASHRTRKSGTKTLKTNRAEPQSFAALLSLS